jgi:hypothetical protein
LIVDARIRVTSYRDHEVCDAQLPAARRREVKAAALTLLLVLPVACGPPARRRSSSAAGYAPWRAIDDRRREWTEDTARIEAQITRLTDDELQLRLQLVGGVRNETYRLAKPPYLCPDLPR